MRQRLSVRKIIGSHEFDVWIPERGPKHIPADAPEPINPHFDGHVFSLVLRVEFLRPPAPGTGSGRSASRDQRKRWIFGAITQTVTHAVLERYFSISASSRSSL